MLLEVASSIQVTLHSKMLHKTQSHCSSTNLIFAEVLNNSYMHTIYLKNKINIAF
jgi:hypothetical protein